MSTKWNIYCIRKLLLVILYYVIKAYNKISVKNILACPSWGLNIEGKISQNINTIKAELSTQ